MIADLPSSWLEAMETSSQRPHNRLLTPSEPIPGTLMAVPAEVYAEALTGRQSNSGWMICPWHHEGCEKHASLQLNGTLWCCFGSCEPWGGKSVAGGNIIDFAGRLKNYALPVRGVDLQELKAELEGMFLANSQ